MQIVSTASRSPWLSWAERTFRIVERGSSVRTEVLAGLTTFMVGAYIIFVNPAILSFSGFPELQGLGPAFGPTLAATCLVTALLTLAYGLWADYPFLIAPGMGLNAVVAFQLILGAGLTWQEAMGVIFLEGLAILILVGLFMCAVIGDIRWRDPEEALPALLTISGMPFSYSITNGIGWGFIVHTFIKLVRGKAGEVHWMMWLASGAFVIYFALPWLERVLGL